MRIVWALIAVLDVVAAGAWAGFGLGLLEPMPNLGPFLEASTFLVCAVHFFRKAIEP